MRFWLRFEDHDVELQPGETVLGRSPRCQMVIDDAMVSRRHARIVLNGTTVTIEDMQSINGVLVNGEKLARARVVSPGDTVVIGQHSFELYASTPATATAGKSRREVTQTLAGASVRRADLSSLANERSEATREGDAFQLLTGVVEKVLALGRGDEAERILANYLRNLLQSAKVSGRIERSTSENAVTYALRIAEATRKAVWVDYCFELYTVIEEPLPSAIVERMYATIRNMPPINLGVLRRYLSVLRAADSRFGPNERFLVRRLQGLEGLATSG